MLSCHPLARPGQRQGDGRQQALRYEGDRHSDGEEESVRRWSAKKHGDQEEGGTHADGEQCDRPDDPVQLLGERALRG
jgi:hypothetical protein